MKEGSFVNLMKVSRWRDITKWQLLLCFRMGVSISIDTRHNIKRQAGILCVLRLRRRRTVIYFASKAVSRRRIELSRSVVTPRASTIYTSLARKKKIVTAMIHQDRIFFPSQLRTRQSRPFSNSLPSYTGWLSTWLGRQSNYFSNDELLSW
jgi:hypothetical protein